MARRFGVIAAHGKPEAALLARRSTTGSSLGAVTSRTSRRLSSLGAIAMWSLRLAAMV